jgi:hypothetical protein
MVVALSVVDELDDCLAVFGDSGPKLHNEFLMCLLQNANCTRVPGTLVNRGVKPEVLSKCGSFAGEMVHAFARQSGSSPFPC